MVLPEVPELTEDGCSLCPWQERALRNALMGPHRQLLICPVRSSARAFKGGESYVARVKTWAPALDSTSTLALLGYQQPVRSR